MDSVFGHWCLLKEMMFLSTKTQSCKIFVGRCCKKHMIVCSIIIYTFFGNKAESTSLHNCMASYVMLKNQH